MDRLLKSIVGAIAAVVVISGYSAISEYCGFGWSTVYILFVLFVTFYLCDAEPKDVTEEQKEELPNEGTWRMDRFGDVYNSKHILYISTNPNGTINIHFADGKVINTMITDIIEFSEKIIGEIPRQV